MKTLKQINSNLIANDQQEKEYILKAVAFLSLFVSPAIFFILQNVYN